MIDLGCLKRIAPKGSPAYEERRNQCQTNLYYLSRVILGRDLEPCRCDGANIEYDGHDGMALIGLGARHHGTHCRITDFFVHKSPSRNADQWVEHFLRLDALKTRLLLYPRGSYKSSIDIDDVVQWVINFPDIRIMFLPGDDDLGKEFLIGVNSYFVKSGGETPFQYLFPEHCILEKEKYENEFTTPARKKKSILEPTVSFKSLESSMSGHHYDVMKPDDAVTNRNSQTQEAIKKVKKNFYINKKMLRPGGYCDGIGTIYADGDLWIDMKEKADAYQKRHGEETLKYLCEPAWTVKLNAIHKKEEDLEEEDVQLLFPKVLTFNFLRKEMHDDPDSFSTQYMLRTKKQKGEVRITEEMIRMRTISWDQLPHAYKTYSQWDLAYSSAAGRDSSVGAHGQVDENAKMFVVEITAAQYSSGKETSFAIVDGARRHKPDVVRIEDSLGVRWLQSDIDFYANQYDVSVPIEWVPINNKEDAKNDRARVLLDLIVSGRVWFLDSISCYDEMLKQLTKRTAHDDIKDDLALLVQTLPKVIPMRKDGEDFNKAWEELRRREGHAMIYQLGEYAPKEPDIVVPVEVDPSIPVHNYFNIGNN